jgi:4-hydroxy-tetrahydrodipicolinate reductase
MKIALIGFGGMGQSAEIAAIERQHQICAIIDPKNPKASATNISLENLNSAEVAIDFSSPASALPNLESLLKLNIPTVMGTTGWYDKMSSVKDLVSDHKGKVLWSSNFSVGVNVYYKIVEAAAKLINNYAEYDIWGTELHHIKKADSPSGTAKIIEQILLSNIERKTVVVEDKLDRAIQANEIHFSSTRGGAVNFSHTIGFDSAADTITLTHSARNRGGYALGAIQTAEWLINQPNGFYAMEDFLGF